MTLYSAAARRLRGHARTDLIGTTDPTLRIARMVVTRRAREVLASARRRARGEVSAASHDAVIRLYEIACQRVEALHQIADEARMIAPARRPEVS